MGFYNATCFELVLSLFQADIYCARTVISIMSELGGFVIIFLVGFIVGARCEFRTPYVEIMPDRVCPYISDYRRLLSLNIGRKICGRFFEENLTVTVVP
jgi:hypothetical protein